MGNSGVYRLLADDGLGSSVAGHLRDKRFAHFLSLLPKIPLKILDVGGTAEFWLARGLPEGFELHILNLGTPSQSDFKYYEGDARDMSQFSDGQFDVVFSNSVIEHVGNLSAQQQMADEVMRVAKAYYVQTPNYYFPIEPHFFFPGFQFLPKAAQKTLVRNFKLGCTQKAETPEEAELLVDSVQLLTKTQLKTLFPTAEIWEEKMLGLTKSLTAYSHHALSS